MELPHPPEVLRRKTPDTWLRALDMNREFLDHGFAPFLGLDFPADIAAHLPVEIDQGGIDSMKRLLLGAVNKPDDFGERGFHG